MSTPPQADRAELVRRTLDARLLFAVLWTVIAAAIYFSLGVVAGYALGLTPVVFLAGGLMFALALMTYVEGASLHQDRAGSTVFARYAFNELWSFVAGWAMLLDYIILLAVCVFAATNYLEPFWSELGDGGVELVACFGLLAYVAIRNVRGFSTSRSRRIAMLVVADIAVQLALVVLGLVLLFDASAITDSIDLGTTPTWEDLIVALGIATVVSTGMESAAGLSGEIRVSRRDLRRVVTFSSLTVVVVYVGIALVAMSAVPVIDGQTALSGRYEDAPLLGIADAFDQQWLNDATTYVIAVAASVTLVAAANSAMLGLSRLAYSLSTNRQIPSGLGKLHPTRYTPVVFISLAALLAAALTIPQDIDMLLGLYAFGALLSLTIAHAAIIRMRFKEPDLPRPYAIPLNLPVRGGERSVPVPAVVGFLLSALAWLSVLGYHGSARWVGAAWMVFGLGLYVIYRTGSGKPLLKRVTVPQESLRGEQVETEYGSILVPVTGTPLDDDIMQTAGRLAAEEDEEGAGIHGGATIEAIWVFEIPMALPIDARLPDADLKRARAALARAKAVGEEYEGVQVATATIRARRTGHAIVDEARRRGVQAIVLAAEEPSKIRGGARLGGRPGLENYVGEVTKQVVAKAPCPVILTAPPVGDRAVSAAAVGAGDGAAASSESAFAEDAGPSTRAADGAAPEDGGRRDG
jgi:APA family basic amino acid/polyamine antiporter